MMASQTNWETPCREAYNQRGDAIYNKLMNGEISVGLANKLSIERDGTLQTDLLKRRAQARD